MRRNIFLLFLVHGTNYLFPLLVLPYQTRVLNVSAFADVAKIQAVIMLLSLIVNFGYNLSSTRDVARATSQHKIDNIYSVTIYIKVILTILCLIVGVAYLFFANKTNLMVPFFISSLYLFGSAFFATWLFQGLEKMNEIVISTSIAKVIGLALTFYLVRDADDVNAALFTQNIGMFVSGLISLYLVHKYNYARFRVNKARALINSFHSSWPFFLSLAATSVYTYLNVIILSFLLNDTQVANFSAADKLRMAAQGLLIPVGQAVFPRLSKLKNEDYANALKVYAVRFILFSVLLSISMLILGEWVTKIYLGEQYLLAGSYVQAMFLLPIIIAISTVYSQWILIPTGKEKTLSRIYIIGALSHIIYTIPFVYFMGGGGMIVSIILTESIIILLMFRVAK